MRSSILFKKIHPKQGIVNKLEEMFQIYIPLNPTKFYVLRHSDIHHLTILPSPRRAKTLTLALLDAMYAKFSPFYPSRDTRSATRASLRHVILTSHSLLRKVLCARYCISMIRQEKSPFLSVPNKNLQWDPISLSHSSLKRDGKGSQDTFSA